MSDAETKLDELCRKMEETTKACGGLPHVAEQYDWGCDWEKAYDNYRIFDCDGETLAVSETAEGILKQADHLISRIENACAQAAIEE